jgi:cytochrome bd-type quinol oxidase subunit 2
MIPRCISLGKITPFASFLRFLSNRFSRCFSAASRLFLCCLRVYVSVCVCVCVCVLSSAYVNANVCVSLRYRLLMCFFLGFSSSPSCLPSKIKSGRSYNSDDGEENSEEITMIVMIMVMIVMIMMIFRVSFRRHHLQAAFRQKIKSGLSYVEPP